MKSSILLAVFVATVLTGGVLRFVHEHRFLEKPSCTILKDQYGQPYNYAVTATGTEKHPMTREKCEDEWHGVFNEGG